MNLSMIPADVDPRVKDRLDSEAAAARSRLAEAERAVASNEAAHAAAHADYRAAEKKAERLEGRRGYDDAREAWDRQWRRYESALNAYWNALAFRRNARAKMAELENPVTVAQLARREQEKRDRLDHLKAERERIAQADADATDTGVTRIVETKARRGDYPQVSDNGDGLAQLDRERLRALSREHGLGVGGHKAVVIERLREKGVTA